MARRLAATVTLTDPKTRAVVVFRPGDTVPAWAQKAITNPAAWATDGPDQGPEEHQVPPVEPSDGADGGDGPDADAGSVGTDDADAGTETGQGDLEEPARAGRGSSLEAWQDYADALGIEYGPDAGRDDIIALVDQAR